MNPFEPSLCNCPPRRFSFGTISFYRWVPLAFALLLFGCKGSTAITYDSEVFLFLFGAAGASLLFRSKAIHLLLTIAALTGCAIHFGYRIIRIEMILGAGDHARLDMMNIALLVVFAAAAILISLIAIVVWVGYVFWR